MVFVVFAGGVGAARFLSGWTTVTPPSDTTVIVNTGDDTDIYGLAVSPDVDIVLYTLAGVVNPETGWGIAGDTTHALHALGRLGQPTWFRLGDQDLATHLTRTQWLREGCTPTEVTARLASALGVVTRVLPMTDSRVRTMVTVASGELPFQEYFVRRGQQDDVLGLRLAGVETAQPAPGALDAIADATGVIIAPSNPFVSIGTILSVPGYREALRQARGPIVAVSPIVGGAAIKGPLAGMLRSLGHDVSALGVARLYAGLATVFVLDRVDGALESAIAALGMRTVVTNTIMSGPNERAALARVVLEALG